MININGLATKLGFPPSQGALAARSTPTLGERSADSEPVPSGLRAGGEPTTAAQIDAVRREMSAKIIYMGPHVHAQRLLAHLQQPDPAWPEGWPGGEVRSSHVQAVYVEMCHEVGLTPFTWQRVGEEFRRLLGGKRLYRPFYDERGRRQRLAVFDIPPLSAGARQPQPRQPPASRERVAVLAA